MLHINLAYPPDTNFWKGMEVIPQDIILLYGISLQFEVQMVALLKHKLNEFCMHDGLENGRQQDGQEVYHVTYTMRTLK